MILHFNQLDMFSSLLCNKEKILYSIINKKKILIALLRYINLKDLYYIQYNTIIK